MRFSEQLSFEAIARRRWLAVLLTGLLAFIGSVVLSAVIKPEPNIHDEFCYLLAADTFAHGKLTNPQHALRLSFETSNVLTEPTYASKYPPAQGLIMALGQVLTGSALVGVWLSVALACAAICWMLQAWLPYRWAFLGGLFAVVRLVFYGRSYSDQAPTGYWSQSYWGGAVAAFGGALLFGALRRLSLRANIGDAIVLASGLAVLAASRPFEGVVASLPAILALARFMARPGISRLKFSKRVLLPILAVLLSSFAWLGFYNFTVTGNAFLVPHLLYAKKFFPFPLFLFHQPPKAPVFHNLEQKEIFDECMAMYKEQQTVPGFFSVLFTDKLIPFFRFYLDFWLFIPLLGLSWAASNRWTKFALIAVGVELLALASEAYLLPHYGAPITCLMFFLPLQCLRLLSKFPVNGKRKIGAWLSAGIIIAFFTSFAISLVVEQRADPGAWYYKRAEILKRLEKEDGQQLVFVRYGLKHCVDHEWVYNQAYIDNSKVVWVRDIDANQNKKVLQYYQGRTVWLLTENADFDSHERPILVRLSEIKH